MQQPTPLNRKPQFLWKTTRWKQIAPRENNILAGAHSGGQLDPNACMIYHFLYLLLCVWGCCVEHNDPWLKIELRLWDGRGAILIRCLLLRTQQDCLKSMVLNSHPFPVNAFEVGLKYHQFCWKQFIMKRMILGLLLLQTLLFLKPGAVTRV